MGCRIAPLFLQVLDFELSNVRGYCSFVDGSVASDLQRIGAELNDLSEQERDVYINCNYDNLTLVRDEVPSILRSTTFIALYAVLEHRLRHVCGLLKRGEFRTFRGRPKESYLDRARRFIEDECGRRFPRSSAEWCLLNGHFRSIRNCLVHDAGEVRGDEAVMNAISTLKGVEQSDRGEIILEDAILEAFAGSIRRFFGELAPMALSELTRAK